jgi:hypothetical protein
MSREKCIFAVLLLSIRAAGQGVPVLQNPTANQSIVQPPGPTAGTTFSTNNEAGILYVVPSYNWTQSPSLPPSIIGTTSVTVTLNTCPAGMLVLPNPPVQPFTRLWLAGTGTPEAVAVTATSCPLQGGGTGTVTFSAAFNHPQGYTLGSASQGIQEAINAANITLGSASPQLGKVIVPPGSYTAKARISISGNKQYIDANGAVLTCTMAHTCVFVGNPGGGTTNATVTSDVTIDGLAVQAGYAGRFPALEDDAQHTTLRSISTRNSSSGSPTFASIIQIDDDQSAVIEKFDPGSQNNWAHCGTDWCSVAIYGPGPFSTNAGVLWVKDSVLSAQCAFNGIDNQNANSLRVSDTIVEAYPQFGIRATGNNTNVAATLDNVHMEGGCTNTSGVGIAGFISEGYTSDMQSTGPVGVLPQFGNPNSTQNLYAYYIVVNSKVGAATTTSAAYLAGWAYQTLPITVSWPQVGSTGTITYDLLRQSVADLSENTAAPYGKSPNGTGASVATGIATTHCSNSICSFTDTSASTTPYQVTAPSTFAPALTFWPGSVILTEAADSVTDNGGEPRLYTDIIGPETSINLGGLINSYGANAPTVFAQQCSGLNTWSSIWVSCPAGDSISNGFAPIGALLLQTGLVSSGEPGGYKGRLNLMAPYGVAGSVAATHLITLGDSNPAKTLATPGHRPSNDASDTWIGLDQGSSVAASLFQLAFGAPVSVSSYIGNTGDNTSWLERLTSSAKTFNVPITANQSITTNSQFISTLTGGAPFSVASATPVANLASQFAQGLVFKGTTGNIGGSLLGAGHCASGTVTIAGATASMTAVVSPYSNPLADANHGLAIWAFVSSANTVTVEVCAIVQTTPTQTTYNVRVSQ